MIYKRDAVSAMIHEMEKYAKSMDVSLSGNIPNDVNDLDDLFNDGGQGRCEHFVDLAFGYGYQFGTLDDYNNPKGFEAHVYRCVESALALLKRKYGGVDYAANPSGYGRCMLDHDHEKEFNMCVYAQ